MAELTFDTGLNLKDLEKDLAEAKRLVEKYQKDVAANQDRASKATNQKDTILYQLEEARNYLEELKGLMNDGAAQKQMLANGQSLTDQITEQEKAVAMLEKQYNAAKTQAQKMQSKLEESEKNLQASTENAALLKQKLEENTPTVSAWQKVGVSVDKTFASIGQRVKQAAKRALIFGVILSAFNKMRGYLTEAVTKNDEAARSIGQLKGAFQTMAQPLVNLLIPAVITLATWLTRVLTAITQIIAQLTGKNLADFQKQAEKGAGGKGGKNLSMASFDTINKLDAGGGSGGSGEDKLQTMYDVAALAKDELMGMLALVGAIGAAFMAWKFPAEGLSFLSNMILYMGVIVGLAIAIYNWFDAWKNGIDGENLIGMIGGITLAAAALWALFGPMAAGIMLVVSGIALLVLGFKDVMENGANMANVLTIITGIIAAGLGIALLTGSFIPLMVAGILSIIAIVVALGGQFEELAAAVKLIFGGIIKFITGVFTGDWKLAWEGIKDIFKGLWNTMLAIVGGVVNAIIRAINWVTQKINETLHFSIPDWIPFIGGNSWSPNIPAIPEWKIPYLAQGAVIPPNRQFMAVLGDQKSGTNIEAPLDTIVQAFRQAQSDTNVTIEFTGSLSQLARVLTPSIKKESARLGSSFIGG